MCATRSGVYPSEEGGWRLIFTTLEYLVILLANIFKLLISLYYVRMKELFAFKKYI